MASKVLQQLYRRRKWLGVLLLAFVCFREASNVYLTQGDKVNFFNHAIDLPHVHILPSAQPSTVRMAAAVMVTKDVSAALVEAFHAYAEEFSVSQNKLYVHLFFYVGKGGHPMIANKLALDITGIQVNLTAEHQQLRNTTVRTASKTLPRFVVADCEENMNGGKTFELWSYASKYYLDSQWIVKIDTDVALNWTTLLPALTNVSTDWRYVGSLMTHRTCGGFLDCPPRGCVDFSCKCWVYMQGGFYGISGAVAKAIAQCEYANANKEGPEDAVTARMIKFCTPEGQPVQLVNFGYQQKPWCHSKGVNMTHIRHGNVTSCLHLPLRPRAF